MRTLASFVLATVSALVVFGCASASSPQKPEPPRPATGTSSALQQALQSIVDGADGTVAVTVRDLSTGEHASIRGEVRLPMMSVFKLPLAVVTLSMIEEGKLDLAQHVEIKEGELRPGVSPLADEWHEGQHAPTLETMLVRMLQDSDNTAGDKLVALGGGGPAITARLRSLGVQGIDVAEQEIEIDARMHCPGASPPPAGWTPMDVDRCPKPTPEVALAAARREIVSCPNGATTDALVDMLAALDRGALLSDTSRAWLHATLAGVKTGVHRLRAGLPEGTRIEHKTGTGETVEGLNVATNDVGVVTLPSGGRFAIAVLTAGSHADDATREKVIASLAKASWGSFTRHD